MAEGQVAEVERIVRKACRMNGKDFEVVKKVLDRCVVPTSKQLDTASSNEASSTSTTTGHGEETCAINCEVNGAKEDTGEDVAGGHDDCAARVQGNRKETKDSATAKYSVLDLFRHKAVLVPLLVTAFVW